MAAIPDLIMIDGHAVSWSRVREKRREMLEAAKALADCQPALFELVDDHKPAAQRTAADRYRTPSLFDWSPV